MNIPISSKAFKSGFVERGIARIFGDIVTEDIPKAVFGNIPPRKIDRAVKHLFKCKSAEDLRKHFKFHKTHALGLENLQRKVGLITDFSKQALLKRQDYIAIPLGLYAGHKFIDHMTKPIIEQKNHFQKIIGCGVKEINNYTQKFIDKPILASLAIGGAIYGGTELLNRTNPSTAKQQDTVNETF